VVSLFARNQSEKVKKYGYYNGWAQTVKILETESLQKLERGH
jgi:hypothetical protein